MIKARFSKKALTLAPKNSWRDNMLISVGAFGLIYTGTSIYVQPHSFVHTGIDSLGTAIQISDNGPIPVDPDADTCIWLNIEISNAEISSAKIEYGSTWWVGYPATRKFGEGQKKSPETQTNHFLPVGFCSAEVSDGVAKSACFSDKLVGIQRMMRGDVILYYACDGFIALPAQCNIPQ